MDNLYLNTTERQVTGLSMHEPARLLTTRHGAVSIGVRYVWPARAPTLRAWRPRWRARRTGARWFPPWTPWATRTASKGSCDGSSS